MKKYNNLRVYYDKEADLLEIMIGEPSGCYFEEIADDIFEGRNEKTNELRGFKIFGFMKRGGMKSIKRFNVPLPADITII